MQIPQILGNICCRFCLHILPFLRLSLLVAVWPSFSGVVDSSRIYGNAQQVILIFSFFDK
ncbi:hypothetical protein BCV77_07255 [Salmonella enterica]|nr:hypothetical protein [Salmonella enterica]EAU0254532.1 hypothetical protein [Salmonella enterica]EBQ4002710.1 hypothetical protein [Salmonella enterica]EDR6669298.1 hypothetical protein [Salmonella enterica subsp. enterica]EDX6229003.1 hypothetical protein [Salmonella enterica subsp. houtenae]